MRPHSSPELIRLTILTPRHTLRITVQEVMYPEVVALGAKGRVVWNLPNRTTDNVVQVVKALLTPRTQRSHPNKWTKLRTTGPNRLSSNCNSSLQTLLSKSQILGQLFTRRVSARATYRSKMEFRLKNWVSWGGWVPSSSRESRVSKSRSKTAWCSNRPSKNFHDWWRARNAIKNL